MVFIFKLKFYYVKGSDFGGRTHTTLAPTRLQQQLRRTRIALARSERPSECPVRPAPTQTERCKGDTGAAQAAVPIDKLIMVR